MAIYGINEHKCRVEIPSLDNFNTELNSLQSQIQQALNTSNAAQQSANNLNAEINNIKNGTTIVKKASEATTAAQSNNTSKINNRRLEFDLVGDTLNITYQ